MTAKPTKDPLAEYMIKNIAAEAEKESRELLKYISPIYLVLVSGRRPSSSFDFDRNREESWPHPFEFKIGRHPVTEEGRKVIADLMLGWEQFEHQRADAISARAEENLFRGWSAVLQARNEQADQNQAVPYSDRTIEGNRVTFRTQRPLESSALEQFWEVPLGENRSVRGIIDSVEGDLVMMYVEGSVPKGLPATGILRLDSRSTKAAIKRQKDALDNVKFGKAARADLKDFILHPETCQSAEIVPNDKWWLEEIDVDKREAVQRALAAKDFFVLHGPPGTGKTTFITELILQFLAQNPHKRVLLTSQTHRAYEPWINRAVKRLGHSIGPADLACELHVRSLLARLIAMDRQSPGPRCFKNYSDQSRLRPAFRKYAKMVQSNYRGLFGNVPAAPVPFVIADKSHPPIPRPPAIPYGQIVIPERKREQPLSSFKISGRLSNLLEYANIHRLGDLHSRNMNELARHRSFGAKSQRELRRLLQRVRGVIGAKPAGLLEQPFYIPETAWAINPCELPISIRLTKLLTEKNIVRLQDLHGRKPVDMQGVKNCGNVTMYELIRLVQSIPA